MDLEIKGFLETSFIDWEGKIVSTVYVGLCNFRCPFCHNSGLVEHPQQYDTIPVKKVEQFLSEHKDFIDGICLTGGEPTRHKNKGLLEFLRLVKGLGLQVKLDSNGTDPGCLKDLISQKLVDYIAMDFKGPLDERYDKLVGVKTNLDNIKKSMELLKTSGLDYEFRVTVVPALLVANDIEEMAKSIAGAKKFVLQQFAAKNCWDETLRSVQPYSKEELDKMVETAKKFVPNTIIRGA